MIRPTFIQAFLDKLSHPLLLFANLDLKVLREHAHTILEGTIKFLACISEELRVGDADAWDVFFVNAGSTKVDMRRCVELDYAALQDSVAMRVSNVRMESWLDHLHKIRIWDRGDEVFNLRQGILSERTAACEPISPLPNVLRTSPQTAQHPGSA